MSIATRRFSAAVTKATHTPPATSGMIAGCNAATGGYTDQKPSVRLQWFGRIPMNRAFYTGLIGTLGNLDEKTCAPEGRMIVSFKGPLPAQVASGSADAAVTAYVNACLADSFWKKVGITYWHEPNGELQDGTFSISDYKAAQTHLANLIYSLDPTGRVFHNIIYSAPHVSGGGIAWNDTWMMKPSALSPTSKWSWDAYGGTKGAGADPPYYPAVSNSLDVAYQLLSDNNWLNSPGRWGITEFYCGARSNDPTETGQAQWITDYGNYLLACAIPPHHALIYGGTPDENGVPNFDLKPPRDAWKAFCMASPAA